MGLEQYRRKRSFKETPEPAGKTDRPTARSGRKLRFVVQKHAASRLHYDFRLELDGVMLSWAVPKGPSLDPADKRLAMQVEDHPIAYNSFEGTIPAGNYGAGTVMVWDEGTYESLDGGTAAESRKKLKHGYKSGDLKFRLHGKKLSGGYAVVKMKGRGENSWLLIKKQDEAATSQYVTKQDRSVQTGRSLEEIAAGKQIVKPRAASPKAVRPPRSPKQAVSGVSPMLAKLVDAPFDRPGWLFETKWDGYRAIAEVKRGKVKLYSRNGHSFITDYPPVVETLEALGHDAVLDGEIVVLDAQGRSSFQALQNYRRTGKGRVRYAVFDLLALDGHDLREFPLRDRKELLCKLVNPIDGLTYSSHSEEAGVTAFERAVQRREEGIIAKEADSPYVEGSRAGEWLKIKTSRRQEAVIGGFTQPRGSRKGFGAVLLGVYEGEDFVYIGHTGGGFTATLISELYPQLQKLARKSSPFATEPKPNTPVTWVTPKLVCEVKFQEWTDSGHMRQPIFVGMRQDKPAREVRREVEEPVATAAEDQPDQQTVKVGGHRLKQTHLTKVYWPKDKLTKGDLIGYYEGIADTILPYLTDRPESLHRHPHGIDGNSFYQKDVADQPPSWVKTQRIFSESNQKKINYLVCQDTATLLYLANLGCIELNPWHSRVGSLDRPDYLLIDLDAKTATFEEIVMVARKVRELLEAIKVKSYPKTSGKTGIHICVPLGAKYSYEQAKQFTEILMRFVHEQLPDITSVERSPDKRKGKIYLDFLQNRRGQTMAAPYCVRPVSGAPVSAPLDWEEVDGALDPGDFTIETMAERVAEVGDLWKPVLGKGIDLKRALVTLESLGETAT